MRVAIVNSICARDDAISDAVRGTQRAIAQAYGVEPILYCYACDFPAIRHRIVCRPTDLLFDAEFMRADAVIYHFGLHYDLLDSLFLRSTAKRVVYYHNVTPARFLPAAQHGALARSIRQQANLSAADAIWAASRFNRDTLIGHGLAPDTISVEPLFLKFDPMPPGPTSRPPRPAELLFVGRFVESKGVADLIDAVAQVRARGASSFRLTLAGNLQFSDHDLVARLRRRVGELGMEDVVSFEGQVSDARLAELYARADVFVLPSYHEGFCVPLIEALNARCIPLTYDAGNLADLVGPWGVITPAGDVPAFAAALADLLGQFARGRPATLRLGRGAMAWPEFDRGVADYLKTFSFEAFARRIVSGLERLCRTAEDRPGRPGVDD